QARPQHPQRGRRLDAGPLRPQAAGGTARHGPLRALPDALRYPRLAARATPAGRVRRERARRAVAEVTVRSPCIVYRATSFGPGGLPVDLSAHLRRSRSTPGFSRELARFRLVRQAAARRLDLR